MKVKLTDAQQKVWQELAHHYAAFWETENPLDVRKEAGDKFQALMPRARELGIDINAVCRGVDEMKFYARLSEVLQKEYDNNPHAFKNVRPGLFDRFVRRKRKES